MGKQQNVESWLVNSFFDSPLQAYKPFIFHALLLDSAETGDKTLNPSPGEAKRIDGGMTRTRKEKFKKFLVIKIHLLISF